MGALQKPQLLIFVYFICISVMNADYHYIILLLLLQTVGSCQASKKYMSRKEGEKNS